MTVEEKAGQLLCPFGWPMYEKVSADSVALTPEFTEFIDSACGGMLWGTFRADPWTRKTIQTGLGPRLGARTANMLQRYAIEHSRLGIPLLLAEEAVHGHMAIGSTVFPTGIGLASTWDKALMRAIGRTVAGELRARGAQIGYGPVIDLAREPRWSRVEETLGEDVFLTSTMASSLVEGAAPDRNGKGIISTLKHFSAYGIPEGGHNGNPSVVGERDLLENFLPPFEAATKAGALSVMTSYNSTDGIPSTSNRKLLSTVLRDEWKFGGFVVSDLYSIDGLQTTHHVAGSPEEAAALALNAGVDVDLGANCYRLLPQCLEKGLVSRRQLDRAVYRVLLQKFRLGLFENPYVKEEYAQDAIHSDSGIDLAREAARESIILLKNDGVLPLGKDSRIALVGPNADNVYNLLGDYTAPQERSSVKTLRDGLEEACGPIPYVRGCAIRDTTSEEIEDAVAIARDADVVIVAVGGSSARDFRTEYLATGAADIGKGTVSDMESGEGFDRSSLDLMGYQQKLLEAVKASGTPIVVVYVEGRPLDKRWADANADALLTMFYPGEQAGTALADILFGDFSPSGRLAVSVPRDCGQLPVYYNHRVPAAASYVDGSGAPLYEFGYGLSYTSFEYTDPELKTLGNNRFEYSLTIENTGRYDSDEVVQLYLTDKQASTSRPLKQLRGFERVFVPAGESARVRFTLSPEDFALIDAGMKKVVESGEFTIGVGASSEDIRLTQTLFVTSP